MAKIGIIAGETSGDQLGAGLIHALRDLSPDLHFEGVGGSAMCKEGCKILYDSEHLAVMGFVEPLFHLPKLIKIRHQLKKHFLNTKPDLFIGIDSPDFNLGLELKLREAGIKVVHYVSPSVWAWRKNRIHSIAKATDLVLTLFPFEKKFYDEHQVPAIFVGHPLADQISLQTDQATARRKLNIDVDGTVIALMPGSRKGEVQHMGETFLKAALQCHKQNPSIRFITSMINEKRDQEFKAQWKKVAPDLPMHFFQKSSHDVMAAASLMLVCSGTATLEALLFKCPMVVAYQTNFITYQIAKHLVDVPFISLPNLLSNEKLVPEFIQDEAQPEVLAQSLLEFLAHPEKCEALRNKFTMLHQQLRQDANKQAAKAVLEMLL